jgi:hypothetical protein
MHEHGRLLCIKDALTNLAGNQELSQEQLALFYIKDIDALRGGGGETSADQVMEDPPTEQEIHELIENRE